MNILLEIVIYVALFYVYISVFVIFYSLYKNRDLDNKPIFGIGFLNMYFFMIGCLIGLTVFFAAGFERVLFFIPDRWGGLNESGDWQSTKEYVSNILAFLSSMGLLSVLEKAFIKKNEKEIK